MKRFTRCITTLFLISVLAFTGYGQISQGGSPVSFSLQSKSGVSPQIPVIEMPYVDVDYLRSEDLVLDQIKNIPWRFGFNIEVKIDLKHHGLEETFNDGSKLWRVEIYSPGAVSINLLFDEFQIPPGAELFIYNDSKTDVIGAFTDFNNRSDSVFATIPIRGDYITLEYYEPANPMFSGVLHLSRVTHGYRGPHDFAKAFGGSGSCNVNVACPASAGMEDQIRSAAMLVSGSNGFCSGALINNTNNNGTPYFLSADHCFTNPSSVVFWFNWQSPTCANPPSSPPYQSISGATTRARYSTSDMWLMELSSTPPSNYNVYYSGWNRTMDEYITGKIWGIHHPAGDIKKISWSTLGVSTTTYLQNPVPGNGTHWRVTQWSDGTTTEGGSSGSPLYDPQGRIIGQLHGGYASCTSLTSDWYGKLGVSWTGGGTNATRLSNWLDPTNSGVENLNGYDPNLVTCNPPTNQATGFTSSAIDDHQMTISWTRGNGTSVLVVAKAGGSVSSNPGNSVNYTANSVFGSGSEIGTGNYVVYKGTGTSVTITNLLPGTNYHYAVYEFFTADNCYLTPGLAGNATTTGQAPCTYCTVSASTDDNTGITQVQFNTINNISVGAPAYTDFTNISTSVTVGQSYNLSVRVNTDGNFTVQTRAWIDWNQNCVFDPGEEYNLGSAVNVANGLTSLSPLSITVPAGAATGQTTMRIRAVYGTSAVPAPCGNQNYSEAEDYIINVIPSCTSPTTQASNLTVANIEDDRMTIGWSRGNGTGVIVLARQTAAVNQHPANGTNYTANPIFGSGSEIGSGNFVIYKGTGSSVAVTNLLSGTDYHFAVYEYFVADNCYNSIALTGMGTTTTPCSYCTPTSSTNNDAGITRVIFNTIDNVSTSSPIYSDFTNLSTDLTIGQSYNLSVRVNTSGNFTVQTRAWIDWNQNCVFDPGEEYLLGSAVNVTNGLTTLSPLSITVPANAVPGQTTMRLRTVRGASSVPAPCGNQIRSEAEDYTIIVLSGATCPVPTGLSQVSATNVSATLQWSGSAGGYEIEYGISPHTFTGIANVTGITSNTATISGLQPGTIYQYKVKAICGPGNQSSWSATGTFQTETPELTAVPASIDFGYIASGSTSPSQTYVLSGSWLSAGPVSVTAPSGFQVSLDNNNWQNAVSVNYSAPNLSATTIYVRFAPSGAPASYGGDVANVGGGASVNVAVTGSSIQTCDFEIIISGSGYLDETSFTFTNSLSTVVLSGGTFALGSTNTFNHQSANPPYTFYLETMGSYNDNVANYVIKSDGTTIASGTLQGGQQITISDIVCFSATACTNPTGLHVTNLTQTTADLGWTGPASAVSWDIELGAVGFIPTGAPTQSGVTNPYTYTNLVSGNLYDFYVRAYCGGSEYSNWFGPFTFSTLCPPISNFPYNEDFSGGYVPPQCWSTIITNHDYTWYYSSGLEWVTCQYDPGLDPQDEWLVSPIFDFSALTHPKLSFDWAMSYYWGVDPFDNYDLVCHISTDGGIIWNQLWEEADEGVFSTYMWATKTIDLISYAGQPEVMIAWQYVGVDGAQANLDNIIVFNDPPPVKTLTVTTFLEGLYHGGGTMRKAKDVDPVTWMYVDRFGGDTADVVTLELVSTTGSVVFTQQTGISTTGVVILDISPSYADSYYIYIRHRNSIAISSANPVSFAGSTITYNFSTAAAQAYSDNQQNLGSGVFGLFGGDVDQDGSVGAFDLILVDNASKIFLEGYIPEDVNGDAEVGAFDLIIVDNNSRNFVFSFLPF